MPNVAYSNCSQHGFSASKECPEESHTTSKSRTRVYVAGPYSGNNIPNMRRAFLAGSELRRRGYVPFVPHGTGLWDFIDPQPYEVWMDYDLQWLAACDCLLRLDGVSPGADKEVAVAQKLGIPVYYSLDTLCASERETRP